MYKVEKGIPVVKSNSIRKIRYPFKEMEVGDSFLVPCEDSDRSKAMVNIRSTAAYHTRRDGLVFVTRMVEGGVRVWRVADQVT